MEKLRLDLIREYFSLVEEESSVMDEEWFGDKFDFLYDLPIDVLHNYVIVLKNEQKSSR